MMENEDPPEFGSSCRAMDSNPLRVCFSVGDTSRGTLMASSSCTGGPHSLSGKVIQGDTADGQPLLILPRASSYKTHCSMRSVWRRRQSFVRHEMMTTLLYLGNRDMHCRCSELTP